MKLPDKFSVRITDFPGLTHTVKRNDRGDYEIRWSRGFFEALSDSGRGISRFKNRVVDEDHMQAWLEAGTFVLVEDKPEQKKQEQALPEVIHFKLDKTPYVLIKSGVCWRCWHKGEVGEAGQGAQYDESELLSLFKSGVWKRYEPIALTPEQERSNKEYREQIAALDSSIKLNEQDIEHKKRLISSYEERKSDLLKKIVEE